MRIAVVGGSGRMGRAAVRWLAGAPGVSEARICDIDPSRSEAVAAKVDSPRISVAAADAASPESIASACRGMDAILNTAPYQHNLSVMRGALDAGCHYVDLGGLYHTTRLQMQLHEEFAHRKRCAVLGMGASPGITNVLARAGRDHLDVVDEVHIRTGGASTQGFSYAPTTILDELRLPAIVFTDGQLKEVPPLTGRERYRLPDPVGEVEGFYALHSELATLPSTLPVTKMVTFRVAFSSKVVTQATTLIELGLASDEPIPIAGTKISPRAFLDALFRSGHAEAALEEVKALRVDLLGTKGGRRGHITYTASARSKPEVELPATAVWTGIPAAIVATMAVAGDLPAGVHPPETSVPPSPFRRALEDAGISTSESHSEGGKS